MLDEPCRNILIEGHRRFEQTKDRTHIDDAIKLVKTISPKDFFQGDKDLNLEKRVFQHEPFSIFWSGKSVSRKKAY